jgi:hypothetical protein
MLIWWIYSEIRIKMKTTKWVLVHKKTGEIMEHFMCSDKPRYNELWSLWTNGRKRPITDFKREYEPKQVTLEVL